MRTRPPSDAKVRSRELLVACDREGSQVGVKRAADLRPGLKELLLSDEARTDELVPHTRDRARRRPPP
jgi:hypothetical protein